MEIKRNEIRPIGYITIEFNEAEIQSIVGCIEDLQMYKNRPMEEIGGIREGIYKTLKNVLKPNPHL